MQQQIDSIKKQMVNKILLQTIGFLLFILILNIESIWCNSRWNIEIPTWCSDVALTPFIAYGRDKTKYDTFFRNTMKVIDMGLNFEKPQIDWTAFNE